MTKDLSLSSSRQRNLCVRPSVGSYTVIFDDGPLEDPLFTLDTLHLITLGQLDSQSELGEGTY